MNREVNVTMTLDALIRKRGPIKKIGVLGMGYVGIPAAALFADSPAFDFVYGFQRDSSSSGYKIAMLNRGESPLKGEEPGLGDLLQKVTAAKKFECTSDFSRIAELDAVTLSIQTPFLNKEDLLPDFSALMEGIKNVGLYLTARYARSTGIDDHSRDNCRDRPGVPGKGVRTYSGR